VAAVVAVVALVALAALVWPGGDEEAGPAAPSTTSEPTATTAPAVVGTPGAEGLGDPYYPSLGNGGYDVDHYTLDLTWRADEGALDGVTTVEATATQDLSRINLDLAG
jgi:hypothetical protein